MAESLAEMSVDASSEVSSVIGSRYPVAVGGTRQAPSGVTIGLAALTSEASAAVRSLIESSPLVVVRPPVGIPALDPVSYLLLPELKPAFPMRRRGGALTTFTTTGQLVRPVSKPVVWARWTYESVAGIYVGEDGVTPLTYDEVQAIATSAGVEYAAVERDPRMGGAL
jgi:hypothetical protein